MSSKRKNVDSDDAKQVDANKKHKTVCDEKFRYSKAKPVPMLAGAPLLTGVSYPFGLEWTKEAHETVLTLNSKLLPGSSKIAAFDMDSTLITTKSGKTFPTGAADWTWWDAKVVPMLRNYWQNGYKIVIFTNQAGIEKKKTNPEEIKTKILALCKALDFPLVAFAAAGTNNWRKPHSEMWHYLVRHANKDVCVDLQNCVYVGDAAGRDKGWKPGAKKDFGCGDRKFAWNCGIPFQTPEEFFLGHKSVPFQWRTADPAKLLHMAEEIQLFEGSSITKPSPEVVLFCGSPAVGKSTFAHTHLIPNGYVWVNRDTLKTPKKCLVAAEAALAQGKSVVVDNTSPKPADRAPYIAAAKKAGVPVRAFVFAVSREIAAHLNFYREHQSQGTRRRVPDVAFHTYNKNAQAPATSEGLSEVCTVNFKPAFDNEEEKAFFLEWTE